MKFELDYIKDLVSLLEESSLTELSLEDGERAIVLKKEKQFVAGSTMGAVSQVVATMPSAPAEAFVCTPIEKKGKPVTSPMVGTFYAAPSPESKPFVEVGSTISEGQVVCIIEAMKLMNQIESEVSGKVVEICVEDGQPIEFGQVLMYVE